MKRYFTAIWLGLKSLITGLAITGRHMLSKPVTLQYPHEKPVLSPAYRGAIKLITFDELESHDCVACKQCERICPSLCIKVEGGKVDGIKKKRADLFTMDFSLCSLCGLCLDVCPTDTLEYSRSYEVAGFDRYGFSHDLLAPYTDTEDQFRIDQAKREAEEQRLKDEAKAKKAAAAKAAKAVKESTEEPASEEARAT